MLAAAVSVKHQSGVSVCMSVCLCVGHKAEPSKTSQPIRIPFGRAESRWPKEPYIRLGTYGHHMANTVEQSVLGGDAACRCHHFHNLLCWCAAQAATNTVRFSEVPTKRQKHFRFPRSSSVHRFSHRVWEMPQFS